MSLMHIPFYATLLSVSLIEGEVLAGHSHVLVYGAIEAHSLGQKGCIASNKTIADETGLAVATVSKVMSQLNAAGWVRVELDENNHRTLVVPLLTMQIPLLHGNTPLTGEKAPPYSTVNIDNSNKITKEKTTTADADALLDELADLLKKQRPRNYALYRGRLRARLSHYTVDMVKSAAAALGQDAFMQGKNDRKKNYATLEYLLREDDSIEKWLTSEARKPAYL